MISERARLVTASFVASDVAMTTVAFIGAHAARTLPMMREWMGPIYTIDRYLPLLAIVLPLWILVFYSVGLYGWRSARATRTEVSRLLRGLVLAGLVFAFLIFVFKLDYVSRPLTLMFLVFSGVLVAAGRSAVRAFILDSAVRSHVLIAGSLEEVRRAAAQVTAHRDWGLEVVGLVSDGTWGVDRSPVAGVSAPVWGAYEDISEIVQRQVVDEVLIATGAGRLEDLRVLEPVLLRLEELGIVTRLVVNFLPQSLADISFDHFGGMPLLTFSTAPRDELLLFVRRCADVALSLALLVLLSPLFAIIALLVKVTSPGPVLFKQTRCGLHGRPFTFLKFRSMRIGADQLKPTLAPYNEMDGPAFKMTNDPRVTPVGAFLRRTSLDELPQLWNILTGSMSFVGPRPSVVEEVRQYAPWQRRRLSMKPGLTCLWQVSGRNELTFDEWMRLDLEYIDNWSLWLDVKIALKTIPAVLLGRGAR